MSQVMEMEVSDLELLAGTRKRGADRVGGERKYFGAVRDIESMI